MECEYCGKEAYNKRYCSDKCHERDKQKKRKTPVARQKPSKTTFVIHEREDLWDLE